MKRRVVAVKWVDSMRTPSWDSEAEVIKHNETPEEIISVGILIAESESRIVVSQALDKQKYEDHVCLTMNIPRCAIIKIITLRLPKGWEL